MDPFCSGTCSGFAAWFISYVCVNIQCLPRPPLACLATVVSVDQAWGWRSLWPRHVGQMGRGRMFHRIIDVTTPSCSIYKSMSTGGNHAEVCCKKTYIEGCKLPTGHHPIPFVGSDMRNETSTAAVCCNHHMAAPMHLLFAKQWGEYEKQFGYIRHKRGNIKGNNITQYCR